MKARTRAWEQRPIRHVLGLAAATLLVCCSWQAASARGAPASRTAGAGASDATTAPVAVYPAVGSRLASPQTQIAFRGVNPLLLSQVTVWGSRSGSHAGKIAGDSDGQGGSFLPSTPFTPGETVTVTASFALVAAPGGSYQFQVASPAGGFVPRAAPLAARAPGDALALHSRPDLHPSAVQLLRRPVRATGQDIFLAPQFGPVQNGPMILDPAGHLVWFHPVPAGQAAADFKEQTFQGKPVLTWWQGDETTGVGVGSDEIYDASYQPVTTVQAANGLSADLHEFQITPAGTALITAFFPVYWDASAIHGQRRQVVLDSVVQEIDIPTGLVLFQWDSLDRVPLTASYAHLPRAGTRNPFDYFHVNSVALDTDGSLIVSARNTWAAYKVRLADGSLIWTLGGKRSSFRMGPGASFAYQHDVRVRAPDDHTITLFDDGAGPPPVHGQSRALELILDTRRMTARLAFQDRHSPGLLTNFEGNVQQLPGGYEFVGWGQQPYFTEFDPRGRMTLDGRFVAGTSSYRAYRFAWTGHPVDPPALAAARGRRGGVTVYASWNGASNVAAWRVLAGPASAHLHAVRTAPRSGFETAMVIQRAGWVKVQALGAGGAVLGASPVTRVN